MQGANRLDEINRKTSIRYSQYSCVQSSVYRTYVHTWTKDNDPRGSLRHAEQMKNHPLHHAQFRLYFL